MKYSVKDMEDIIYAYLPEETGYQRTVLSAMNYAVKAGGKRLRPMMLRLCYDMFAEETEEAVVRPFMAAIEMIHTYSLVHDDLPAMDNDTLRRGLPTVHVRFGEDMAILAGDALLNYAFETAVKSFSAKPGDDGIETALSVLAAKSGVFGMVGGQTLDVEKTGMPMSEPELFYIYENKTGALLAAACTCGAYLAHAEAESVELLRQAAYITGLAFQVQDDILDIIGDESVIGKPLHSDDENHKTTYVTLHGMDAAKNYVREMSEKAVSILESIQARDSLAQADMTALVKSLITRDH